MSPDSSSYMHGKLPLDHKHYLQKNILQSLFSSNNNNHHLHNDDDDDDDDDDHAQFFEQVLSLGFGGGVSCQNSKKLLSGS